MFLWCQHLYDGLSAVFTGTATHHAAVTVDMGAHAAGKSSETAGETAGRGQKPLPGTSLAYDTLLLSEILGACEAYLQGILSMVKVNPALLGMDSVRLTHNEALMGLIMRALSSDSFFSVAQ